ncbi:DUF3168 domain-containing protein [Litorimonas sp. RW-G-Af-16]|uniref:DUF3168 domain-containing protein n=1 Tax=Litorimonas sp. RW-G-Af-16 TaxID=3241168 RepID=UPI00390C7198
MSVSSNATKLAKLVHAVLSADQTLQTLLGDPPRLYDAAPEDPVYPYLTYGPLRSSDDSGDGVSLSNHQMSLHIWSRYAGRAEVFTLLSHVENALLSARGQSSENARISRATVIYADVMRATDGRTLHGLLRLSLTLETEL